MEQSVLRRNAGGGRRRHQRLPACRKVAVRRCLGVATETRQYLQKGVALAPNGRCRCERTPCARIIDGRARCTAFPCGSRHRWPRWLRTVQSRNERRDDVAIALAARRARAGSSTDAVTNHRTGFGPAFTGRTPLIRRARHTRPAGTRPTRPALRTTETSKQHPMVVRRCGRWSPTARSTFRPVVPKDVEPSGPARRTTALPERRDATMDGPSRSPSRCRHRAGRSGLEVVDVTQRRRP